MTKYDEGAELTQYVVRHYSAYLTDVEERILSTIRARQKISAVRNEQIASMIEKRWSCARDPSVAHALTLGTEVCTTSIRERILREHHEVVIINRCPACSRIVRTPKAQQCFWCGHDWHCADADS